MIRLHYLIHNAVEHELYLKMFVSIVQHFIRINYSSNTLPRLSLNLSKSILFQKRACSLQSSDLVKLIIGGEKLNFPSIWLRDNCQCEQCFHTSALSRTIDWSNLDINVTPTAIQESENSVKISWSDGHMSQYEYDWLKIRSFEPKYQNKYKECFYKPTKLMWNNDEFSNIFTKHDYKTILECDEALYTWIHNLAVYGVTLITNAPNSETAIDGVIQKFGFSRKTHYGEKFIVQNVPNTSNVAYLTSNLQIHTDLPYYEYAPGVNILHCLTQTSSEGGENLLSDSHYISNHMKNHHYEYYRLLTDIEVEWADIGTEHGNQFYKLHRAPLLSENNREETVRVNFSVPQRGTQFTCGVEQVKPWYKAQQLFLQLSHKYAAKFKLQAGQILVFDNIRLLHGRNAYVDTGNNIRKLIGAYIDWDEIYSRLRCLKFKLKDK